MPHDGHIEQAVSVLRSASIEGALDLDQRAVLLAVREHIEEVECTWHPLGFMHIDVSPLVGLRQKERLRLHIWTADGASHVDELGKVHDHTWEGRSYILTGCLRNDFFRMVHSHSSLHELAQVSTKSRSERLRVLDTAVGLESAGSHFAYSGSWYFLPRRLIHSTTVEHYPTVTLVLARYIGGEVHAS